MTHANIKIFSLQYLPPCPLIVPLILTIKLGFSPPGICPKNGDVALKIGIVAITQPDS